MRDKKSENFDLMGLGVGIEREITEVPYMQSMARIECPDRWRRVNIVQKNTLWMTFQRVKSLFYPGWRCETRTKQFENSAI